MRVNKEMLIKSIIVVAIITASMGIGTVLTLRSVSHKQIKLKAPDGMMVVRILSIQKPRISYGTQFHSGCVYETACGERFFSYNVLGSTGETFIVRPETVSYSGQDDQSR